MKIAVLAPIAHKTPPDEYGPWELMASLVAEGLVKRGHEVTLFATGDSKTAGKLEAIVAEAVSNRRENENKYWNDKVLEYWHIANCFEKAGQFDIIHNHLNFGPLAFSKLVRTPMVTTLHNGNVEFAWKPELEMYKLYNNNNHYVAISEAAKNPELEYTATIYHGIDVGKLEWEEKPGDYLLFIGRIDADKGTAEAIKLAQATNNKLVIAGIVNDKEYFEKKVQPFVDGKQISYTGSVGGKLKNDLLKNAKALLHLVNFDEPFGLTVVEAQACGTPVIAFNRGSMPEVVDNGKTGYLVEGFEGAVNKVEEINKLERSACRKWVEEKFSQERMVDQYVIVFEKILGIRG